MNNLLRDWNVQRLMAVHSDEFPNRKKNGCISGRTTGLASNFHQFFKLTLYIQLGSFMQIGRISKKFIKPDIRPDIRIVTKIKRDLIWHRNMYYRKIHVASYYHFWAIVWTNIRKRNRINGRISGRITESDSNFHQYFKTTISIYPENFMQIGWILRKFTPKRISGRIPG